MVLETSTSLHNAIDGRRRGEDIRQALSTHSDIDRIRTLIQLYANHSMGPLK